MTRIAVNTRLLRKNQMDGIGWFTFNTMKYIVQKNPSVEFHFLFDSGIDKDFLFAGNIVPHNLFPPAKHALLNIAWFEWSVKLKLKKINPDLFFSPDGILCLGWKGKQHGVIHDINFFHNPGDLNYSNRRYYNHYFPKFAERATRLATVSEYSRKDIHQSFGTPINKIDVVYCGINSFYKPATSEIIQQTKDKYSEGLPYFLFIGTMSPRKNILGLMEAFEEYKNETGNNTKLLIAGGGMYKTSAFHQYKSKMKWGKDIVFTGRLSDDELNKVLGSAMSLTFVPFFEGFGIPLVEAMQCEVPILCSNTTSVPEIVSNAALLVDPKNISDIKNGMIRIASDESLRRSLIEKGRIRKTFFSWEKTADLLWRSIEECF